MIIAVLQPLEQDMVDEDPKYFPKTTHFKMCWINCAIAKEFPYKLPWDTPVEGKQKPPRWENGTVFLTSKRGEPKIGSASRSIKRKVIIERYF